MKMIKDKGFETYDISSELILKNTNGKIQIIMNNLFFRSLSNTQHISYRSFLAQSKWSLDISLNCMLMYDDYLLHASFW